MPPKATLDQCRWQQFRERSRCSPDVVMLRLVIKPNDARPQTHQPPPSALKIAITSLRTWPSATASVSWLL